MTPLTVCSKDAWLPTIRREHAFVHQALDHGIDVVFVEPPMDVRSLRSVHPVQYLDALSGSHSSNSKDGLKIVTRSAPVPGHRNRIAETIDAGLLRRVLTKHTDCTAPTVCHLPWQWSTVANGGRKIFDCGDDWTRLYPQSRNTRFSELFRQISAEADEVILASSDLAPLFPGRPLTIVPNGVEASGIASVARQQPNRRRLAYVGTLSERFDASIVADVLRAIPDWTLELYGSCHYAGRGDRPSPS